MTTIKSEIADLGVHMEEISLQVMNKNVKKWEIKEKYKRFRE